MAGFLSARPLIPNPKSIAKKCCPLFDVGGVFSTMMADESNELLKQFTRTRSEAAFRELVARHSGMVYGTALRQLNGNRSAAEDVMQEVFTLLVQRAPGLGGVTLSSWLYRQTCRRAANHVRTESRRRKRELAAVEIMASTRAGEGSMPGVEELEHAVDDSLLALPAPDRDALTLRFFEGRDYRALGLSLGLTEEAARKRVSRALEKLTRMLQRKGIAVGAGSLSATMSSMAGSPVPTALVTQIAGRALRSAPAAGAAAGALPLIKSFLGGLLASSVVVGAVVISRKPPTSRDSNGSNDTRASMIAPRVSATSPSDLSFDELIAVIKRMQSAPSHALTDMRLEAILESLPTDQVAAFILAADAKLTPKEKDSCYQRLIARWMKADADEAMNFAMDQDLGNKAKANGSNFISALFDQWIDRDNVRAKEWLLSRWQNGRLYGGDFVQTYLVPKALDYDVRRGNIDAALDFINRIPASHDRAVALQSLSGNSPYVYWRDLTAQQRLNFYRGVSAWHDPSEAGNIATSFLQAWARNFTEELRSTLPDMTARERLSASLSLMGIDPPTINHYRDHSTQVSFSTPRQLNFAEAEQDLLPSALAAGLTRAEALRTIGEAVLYRRRMMGGQTADLQNWLQAHSGEVNLDDLLAREAAIQFGNGSYIDRLSPERAIGLVACIQDPDLRFSLGRATFQRLIATAPEKVPDFLKRQDIPADLVHEFQTMLPETP